MTKDSYYKEVKNYIHNDLKITKNEISSLIVNEVTKQVKELIANEDFITPLISSIIKSKLTRSSFFEHPDYQILSDLDSAIYRNVINEICLVVKENVVVSLKNTDMIDKALIKSNKMNDLIEKERIKEIVEDFENRESYPISGSNYYLNTTYQELGKNHITVTEYFIQKYEIS